MVVEPVALAADGRRETADLIVVRREAFCRSSTLVVRVAIFST